MTYLKQTLTVIVIFAFLTGSILCANEIESKFIKAGLVDVKTVDPTILVDLVNSAPEKNYFRENYYSGLQKAYVRKSIALKLSKAQQLLKKRDPGYSLQILDAARPASVSRLMHEKMKGTRFEKYVANPEKGSMHNYGVAVDLTIVDGSKKELDMGFSPFRKTTVQLYWMFARMKIDASLSAKQKANRKLLADVMIQAGFIPLGFEWWHFNGMSKAGARKRYQMIK